MRAIPRACVAVWRQDGSLLEAGRGHLWHTPPLFRRPVVQIVNRQQVVIFGVPRETRAPPAPSQMKTPRIFERQRAEYAHGCNGRPGSCSAFGMDSHSHEESRGRDLRGRRCVRS